MVPDPRTGPQGDVADTTAAQMAEASAREDPLALLAREVLALKRVPVATYRLQFGPAFTFRQAWDLVPYLHRLGISDCYASPYLRARSGSAHGYDVADYNTLNPDLGSEEEYEAFAATLREHGMGQVLDVVPNHMGIVGSRNAWWMDVLENGPGSIYAAFFDIDWTPVKAELKDKVLLPILGDQYGRVLENQELTLFYQDGAFFLRYPDHSLPIAPQTAIQILEECQHHLAATLGRSDPHFQELQSIITALNHLPLRSETSPEKVLERRREKEIIKRRLAALCGASPAVKAGIEESIRLFNGRKGDPRSLDRLHDLLESQAYRLAHWRVAAEEINYRRFFDVNELAAIRMEDPSVFREAHKLILRLIREGNVTGLRIDHPDGLFDPVGYLVQVQKHALAQSCRRVLAGRDDLSDGEREALTAQMLVRFDAEVARDPGTPMARQFYVIVEKILGRGEALPDPWPVDGTTGYEFLNALNGLFVDPANDKRLRDIYARFTGVRIPFPDLLYGCKKLIMRVAMSSELNVLGHALDRLSERNRRWRDFTLNSLTDALREVVACFPVYRTYVGEGGVTERDRAYVELAVARAKQRNPATSASIFDFVRDILLLRYPEAAGEEERRMQRNFVMKFQQFTGPVMAKGLEDTAFYRYNRLASLNEVGGDPERFGITVEEFHRLNLDRLARWSGSLSPTSTHDTKRSEDVRARIDVLSEIPHEWGRLLARWSRLNRRKKVLVDEQPAPDRNDEYLLYQTLVGAWPLGSMGRAEHATFRERVQAYMAKATKEAKVHTSWINPNVAYDEAVRGFVAAILDEGAPNPFLEEFLPFQRRVAEYGMVNSLSQVLLKIASPGVPDIYQGNEIWDFSLVDPDNRRPVDYDLRIRMLEDLRARLARADGDLAGLAKELIETRGDGRIKLYVTHRALAHRRERPLLFRCGAYVPLEAVGSRRDHVCGFARKDGDRAALAVVPRLLTRLVPDPTSLPLGDEMWGQTWLILSPDLGARGYRNIFTGEVVEPTEREGKGALFLGAVFATFPVALLESLS